MVDLILHDEYFGYHEENWKVKSASGVSGGKSSGSVMAEGIGGVMVGGQELEGKRLASETNLPRRRPRPRGPESRSGQHTQVASAVARRASRMQVTVVESS